MTDEAAARLIERVLTDAAFRARFRSDPEAAAREIGLDEPAADGALETLEIRESRSSLAGAMMAAAVEGIGVYDLVDGVNAQGPSVPVADDVDVGDDDSGDEVGDGGDSSDDDADTSDDGDDSDDDDAEDDDADDGAEDEGGDDDDDGDEDEPDEEEPDEEEPDEDEPDEDEDDDDEDDDEDDEDDEEPDLDDGADEGDSDDGSDSDDSGDSDGGGDDDADEGAAGAPGNLEDVDAAYPGDDAPREQIARWMAGEAQRRGLPGELPVMASLVESGMHNLTGGDRDSVGFFQMRVGIWNTGAYAGYPQNPAKQLDWFLDTAESVKAQRIARGAPINDPKAYGEWIADVERPAEQYRGRYQLRLAEARGLLGGGDDARGGGDDAQGGGGSEDAPGGGADGADLLDPGPRAREALAEARKYLGTAYQWGGSSPRTGFDCSGLVQWAYAKAGIRIPRVTDQQILADNATKVGRNKLLPGDLVFFRDDTGYVHHVGMSLGGKRFIHAPKTGDVVKVSSLDEPYYAKEFAGGRRFDRAVPDVPAARTALERDAEEVNRPGTGLFMALERQERADNANRVQVLPAITPDQLRRS